LLEMIVLIVYPGRNEVAKCVKASDILFIVNKINFKFKLILFNH
jgi:hypothetical protein